MFGMYGDDYYGDSHLRNPDGSIKGREYGSEPKKRIIQGKNELVDTKVSFKKYVEANLLPQFFVEQVKGSGPSYCESYYTVNVPNSDKYGIQCGVGCRSYDGLQLKTNEHAVALFSDQKYASESNLENKGRELLLSCLTRQNWKCYRDSVWKNFKKSDGFILEQSLMALNSDEVKAKLSASDRKKLRTFYVKKLENDSVYKKTRTDLLMLDMYIKYKEKQQSKERTSLTARLKKLSASLAEAKEVLPDEKKLMLVQKVARQRLTEELRKG